MESQRISSTSGSSSKGIDVLSRVGGCYNVQLSFHPTNMAAASPIPVYTALEDIFSDKEKAAQQRMRWSHIIEAFEDRYGRKPTHVIRAPGRVKYEICLFIHTSIEVRTISV